MSLSSATSRLLINAAPAQGLRTAQYSFNTRRVPKSVCIHVMPDARPTAGDLVLARVESIGHHPRIQLQNGRRCQLHLGVQIVVAYGHRYAPNQWEAAVPATLGPCDLVAAGGVAGEVLSRHTRTKKPTRICPIGLVADGDRRIVNLRDHTLARRTELPDHLPPFFAVVGTSMDAGKTTAACSLIRGLKLAGHRVGAIKLTGTGSGNDFWKMVDAGAHSVRDFVDAGYASTYRAKEADLKAIFTTLMADAMAQGADVIVAELADGIGQAETEELLNLPMFRAAVSSILIAAGDAMGASAVLRWLSDHGLPARAVSGLVSASTLGAREARLATGLAVLSCTDLASPSTVDKWMRNSA